MKRAAIATIALFFACGTAAVAQYQDRGQTNTQYGQYDNSRNSGMQNYDRNQRTDRSQNGIYQDRGQANATYGDRQAQNYGDSREGRYGRHDDRMANGRDFRHDERYGRDERYGDSGRYRTAYSYRRHCVWHHDHRACFRWH